MIEHHRHHSTHEPFHSKIKSDLDPERLPSGPFDTNDAIPILHLASFAYLRPMTASGIAVTTTMVLPNEMPHLRLAFECENDVDCPASADFLRSKPPLQKIMEFDLQEGRNFLRTRIQVIR